VTGRSAPTTVGWWEEARGHCDPSVLEGLWATVPPLMRLTCFSPATVPAQYAGAFCQDGTWRAGIDLSTLPEPMRREVAWCVFRIIELGGKIPTPGLSMLVHRLGEVLADRGDRASTSLLGLSGRDWCQQIQHAVHRRAGRLPAPTTMRTIRGLLTRMLRLLATALDTGPWWQREAWNPVEDSRIPLREHEPMGRYTVRFDAIATGWLRRGAQWHCKIGLDTGMLSWSTVHRRVVALRQFDAFLRGRPVDGPWLAEHAAGVRALMLDYLGHLRSRPLTRARRGSQHLSPASVQRLASDVEQFYLFMADNKDAAAAALGEPGWLRLGAGHTGFYRRGELPGKPPPRLDGQVIDDDALTQIMGGLHLLGAPAEHGGFGDEQAMRITMLVALLGRRISEICLLDRDPLLPLLPSAGAGRPDPATGSQAQAPVAKLRYQQTKIDGAPDTILVHVEVVAIISEQQEWANRYFAEHGAPGVTPKYLFLATQMNRNGDRPYTDRTLRGLLTRLAARLDVHDSTGAVVDFNRTHRFRHTVATSLLNAGVPLHVLQRYLGHLTPTMTMAYAQTLQSTAEREFLRYRKVTNDGRELQIDPQDLYDMLELDRRTDRILPNGWCLLAPCQACGKGNACLTCDKFATDATFLPELHTHRSRTDQLIDERRAAFRARTGQDMGEDNVWLTGRRQEHDALGRIIHTLEHTRSADGTLHAVRGGGVAARTDAITDNQEGT